MSAPIEWVSTAKALSVLEAAGIGLEVFERRFQAGIIPAKAARLLIDINFRRRSSPKFPAVQHEAHLASWFFSACEWNPQYPPRVDWLAGDVEVQADADGTSVVAKAFGVHVDLAAVRAIIPESRAASNIASLASAEWRAEQWLRERFSDPAFSSTPKAELRDQALSSIDKLSGKGFNRVWASLVRHEYPERGVAGRKISPIISPLNRTGN